MSCGVTAVTGENFAACIDFLAPREFRCVSLTSYLCEKGMPVEHPDKLKNLVCLYRDDTLPGSDRIDGIVFCSPSGIILHCLRENTVLEAYEQALASWLSGFTIFGIIGTHDGTIFLEDRLAAPPERAIEYRLMTLDTLPGEEMCRIPGLTVQKATETDADELLPLQENYEKEEVVPPGNPFSREACLAGLKANLRKQFVCLMREHGVCIAKAGTNAQGLHWDQIGGVYTAVAWRGRGIASALTAHVARERMLAGRKIVLFVKTANVFAQKAYKKAGFKSEILFRISYYPL